MTATLLQLLTGLASASSLFLVASGLTLIFGVTRIVNFAHGSFAMVGLYVAVAAAGWWLGDGFGTAGAMAAVFGPDAGLGAQALGWWGAVLAAALAVAALGALVETVVLRRVYGAPELYQLLATFALVLILRDAALRVFGPEDLLGPRAPGLGGAVAILGEPFPVYDLVSIAVGPLVWLALVLVLTRTRFGLLVRAATEDRAMVGALGIDQRWLFTAVFALGSFLAGLGGALQMPREPASLGLDLAFIGEAFVVVVVGGLGSIGGAFAAAVIVALVKAACIAAGSIAIGDVVFPLSRLTLVAEFAVMAAVLVWRPWGLFGTPQPPSREERLATVAPATPLGSRGRALAIAAVALLVPLALLESSAPYALVLLIDIGIAALFAASLHLLMGPAGMPSFGHAAFFGLGAYGAAWLVLGAGLPMEAALVLAPLVAAAGALLFGAVAVRLGGVYLAMLTLAFAQIVWSVTFQWDAVTGGSNGLVGLWPAPWLASRAAYYLLVLACTVAVCWLLVRLQHAPFGLALRAMRDSPVRAAAIGIDLLALRRRVLLVSGTAAGLAGALFAFAKGSISPETLAVGRSVDGLVMVLLGGVQTVAGPWVGAAAFTWLQDTVARETDYWRAMLGATVLALVLAFPQGIVGGLRALVERRRPDGDRAERAR